MLKHRELLSTKRIVLASASPRRLEILRDNGGLTNIVTKTSGFAEDMDKSVFASPAAYVEEYAKQKAAFVRVEEPSADLVIGSDTVVVRDGIILEKPANVEEAVAMLASLSGRHHTVYSGVCINRKGGYVDTFHVETQAVHS